MIPFTIIIDVDFNATVQRITLLPNRARGGDERMYVDIFDDVISELVEEFTVYLRVVNGPADVQLGRNRLTVIIRMDSADGEWVWPTSHVTNI